MSGGSHYERYKDALKRGHVASIRGRLEDALTAYAEAAAIAPERSTPHTSAGTALLRRRRPADALRHYAVALRLAPRDEAALLGRAQALAALDQRGEAADAYMALADARADSGSLSDAVDAARRGLELAEGRERRRTLERLIEKLRATEPDEPGRAALERALRVLDGVAVTPAVQPGATAPAVASDATPESVAAGADEPGPAIRSVLDRDLPAGLGSDDLARSAEVALGAGDTVTALGRLLDLAAHHRRAGQSEAALDALYEGLTFAHDDVDLHLALVTLYGDRGWTALADEKLSLLGRLAMLEGDEATLARVAAAGSATG
jgi:tetratricopeptide (TPR) repeat protein